MTVKRIAIAIKKFLIDKNYRKLWYLDIFKHKNMPDEVYISKRFEAVFGKKLNLDNPKTFNEKMQWLKLYDREDDHTIMVDKYLSKEYVSKKVGEEYVAKLLGVWDKVEQIDFSSLPNQFVLKTTHDCGGVIVCKDKSKLNKRKVFAKLKKHLRNEYFYHCREWPYKNVIPRIIAEEYLEDKAEDVLPVYKFLCFNGQPKIIQVIQNDKKENETVDYYDEYWSKLELKQNYPNSDKYLDKPSKFEKMLEVAIELAKDKPFIRVDLYLVNDKIYFSEFTFFSDAGFKRFYPEEWDEKLGSWINLPVKG